jgi:hypothetical protein
MAALIEKIGTGSPLDRSSGSDMPSIFLKKPITHSYKFTRQSDRYRGQSQRRPASDTAREPSQKIKSERTRGPGIKRIVADLAPLTEYEENMR